MKTFKLLAPLALIAAISAPVSAYDLSIGAAKSGDLNGFTLQLGGEALLGAFNYTTKDTVIDQVSGTLDNTSLVIGYKIPVVGALEVYPTIGGGFYTYHDAKGISYSESYFTYGGGVRYTLDKVIIGYSIQFDKLDNTQSLTLGYQF